MHKSHTVQHAANTDFDLNAGHADLDRHVQPEGQPSGPDDGSSNQSEEPIRGDMQC